MSISVRRFSPILGVPDMRQAAEYDRDVLGFTLDPIDGIFEPPGTASRAVYAIVKMHEAWIHFQIQRSPSSGSTQRRRSIPPTVSACAMLRCSRRPFRRVSTCWRKISPACSPIPLPVQDPQRETSREFSFS